MQKLSVAIVCKNEEDNIGRCLESVKWADEIVVVDSGSTDNTVKICCDFGCRVIESEWLGFGKTKAFAVSSVKNDWVLSLDADEQVTPPLKRDIERALESESPIVGYYIRFITFYLGHKIRFSGWQNEYHLRLFNRKAGSYNEHIIHEGLDLEGERGKLRSPIYHYSFPSLTKHLEKMARYAELSSEKKASEGKSVTLGGVIGRGLFTFIQIYFLRLGFLDGRYGLILAINNAFANYIKYLMLWKRKND
jgi:glycosyltransferase involved in cell wall biosynthesis